MIFLYSSESQRSYVIFPEWTYLIHPDIELGSRPTHFCAEGRPEPTPPNATHLSQNTPQEDGTENLSEIVQCGVPKLKRNRVQLVHITNQFHYGLWYQNNYSIHGLHRPTNKHNSGAPHCRDPCTRLSHLALRIGERSPHCHRSHVKIHSGM